MTLYSGDNPEGAIITNVTTDTVTQTLGVFLNFTGTFGTHAKELQHKSDSMTIQLEASNLCKPLAYKFYKSMYSPAV